MASCNQLTKALETLTYFQDNLRIVKKDKNKVAAVGIEVIRNSALAFFCSSYFEAPTPYIFAFTATTAFISTIFFTKFFGGATPPFQLFSNKTARSSADLSV